MIHTEYESFYGTNFLLFGIHKILKKTYKNHMLAG